MKSQSNIRPEVITAVGDGSYLYHYNITEKEVHNDMEGGKKHTTIMYEYDEVKIWGEPDANSVVQAVLTEECDVNREQKLINEYNSAKMGLLSEEESEQKVSAYEEYLQKRAALKAEVDAYFDVK